MQVAIREEDQSALRILWLEDGIVRHYQYARLIFGATCSPCCIIFVLYRCAADLSDSFPDVYETVLNNFYMDDFIMSFATAEDDCRPASNLRTVLQHRGFLHGFLHFRSYWQSYPTRSFNPILLALFVRQLKVILQNLLKRR